MIRLIKMPITFHRISCSIFLIFSLCTLYGQGNIWDDSSSLEYGKYLMNKGDFKEAAEEFQRYLYFNKSDKDVVSLWVRAYAKGGKEKYGLRELNDWFRETEQQYRNTYYIEKSWLLMRMARYKDHAITLSMVPETWRYKKLQKHAAVMLQGNWEEAARQLQSSTVPIEQRLYEIAHRAVEDNYKSPLLAGVLSAVVPGTGKFYVGRYIDGAISMLFVGVMTYQAVRFFQIQGVKSWPAWIYTGLGGAYYSASIYGSVKAAKEYNKKKVQKYVDETNRILYSVY